MYKFYSARDAAGVYQTACETRAQQVASRTDNTNGNDTPWKNAKSYNQSQTEKPFSVKIISIYY